MEFVVYVWLFLIYMSGVSSQSVTITADTVYILNNALGQVTCTLYGNCNAIVWFLSSIQAPVATVFVGFSCSNKTSGYYQTCDEQNHQYTMYFTGTTSLHGLTLNCSGEGCSPQQTVSDTVTISIIVPVPSVSLEGISGQQITVIAGQSKSITCVTGASRPTSHILWYIGMTNMTSSSKETQIPSQELFYTRSILTFIPTKSQNGLQINCKAYNIDNNMVELTTKRILNIQYGLDQVILSPSSLDNIVIETYQIGPIKCYATCEPPCNYKWIRPNQDVIQGDTLTISSIQRTQTGTYMCQAYNTVGTQNSSDISVIVHYAAAVTRMEINNRNNFTIPEHSIKTITCLAEGLPQPTITLRYISNNSIIKSVSGLRLDFTFSLSRCEDTGIYKCEATNKFTPRLPLQRNIFVQCQPRLGQKPLQQNLILSTGESLNITVQYIAYPGPTFQWFKNVSGGSSVLITDDQKDVQIQNYVVNTYTFVTELIRTNLKKDDFGTYILKTSNIIGTNENVFTVRPVGKPYKPTGGLATCIGSSSGVITWTSGSNNGDRQTFNIVYQEVDGTEQTLVSDITDPGIHKPISHTILSLKGSKTYIFQIYSRNSFGESSRLTVNCSTTAKPKDASSNTGVAVGVTFASVVILIIIVVGVIFFLRRFQSAKGDKDITKGQVNNSLKQDEKVGESNEINVYNDIVAEDAYEIDSNIDKNILKYETLQTPNDQQIYEQIRMEDVASTVHDTSDINTYEGLDDTKQESEANTYETLTNKQPNEDQIANIYINTAMRIRDGINKE